MNRVCEPLIGSKMAITHKLKLCMSIFSRGIGGLKEGYQGTNITLIFTRPADSFLIPNFRPIFACLSVNSLIDGDSKQLYFMSLSNFRLILLNPSQIFKIDTMVTFLWLIKRLYFLTHPVYRDEL